MRSELLTTAGYSTIVAAAPIAVDLMFAISGFLLSVKTLERFDRYKDV
jgi:peptidoglycan/LPS O-acetylase OafA/YrhL